MLQEQITALLPPIALSLGAILPFLIASPPFSVVPNAKVLLACLMTLVIWIGYWIAYLIGDWAFFSHWFIISLVGAALLVFGSIFHVAQLLPKPVPAKDDAATMTPPGPPAAPARLDQPHWLWLYLFGLVLVSVAAALYIGPKERVIVALKLAPRGDRNQRSVTRVEIDNGHRPVEIDMHRSHSGAEVMLTKAEFLDAKRFLLELSVTDGQNRLLSEHWIADKSDMVEQLKPGLSEHVLIRAYFPQGAVP